MYGKAFQSTYTGSMVGSGSHVFAVWGYVISHIRHSDKSVELNPKIIATIIGETPETIEKAISFLTSPDPNSRSPEEEGRRLVKEAPFLYRVVNAVKYAGIKDEDGRREYMRNYMKTYRSEKTPRKQVNVNVNKCNSKLTQEDVDVDVDVDVDKKEEVKVTKTAKETSSSQARAENLVSLKIDSEKPKNHGNAFQDWTECNIAIGRVAPIGSGIIFSACKRIATAIPDSSERKTLFAAYLADDDAFLASNGYSLKFFEGRIEKYRNADQVQMKNGYDARKIYISSHNFWMHAEPKLTKADEKLILQMGNLYTKDEFRALCKVYGESCVLGLRSKPWILFDDLWKKRDTYRGKPGGSGRPQDSGSEAALESLFANEGNANEILDELERSTSGSHAGNQSPNELDRRVSG